MWYLVLSQATGREEQRQQSYQEHLDWLLEQHRAGRALFSGPTSDRSHGIYVLRAADQAEAEKLAASDPHHVRGERTMQVLEWDVRRAAKGITLPEAERLLLEAKPSA